MQGKVEEECYQVVCLNGSIFRTRAKTALEYILDPAFIQFIALSFVLYAAAILTFDLPIVAQLILMGSGMMTTFVALCLAIAIHLWVSGILGTQKVYTPLLLIPVYTLNTTTIFHVTQMLDEAYMQDTDFLWETAIKGAAFILTLDIFHANFVAPQHQKFAGYKGDAKQEMRQTQFSAELVASETSFTPRAAEHAARATQNQAPPAPASLEAPAEPASTLTIGNKSFDLSTISLIRSEDHYLLLQQGDQSTMVRGKLKDVSDKVDVSWGIQINRSVWLAYTAIEELRETSSGALEVILKDGSRLKVAEARRVFFNHSYGKFKSDQTA